jgi:hypothetical protein
MASNHDSSNLDSGKETQDTSFAVDATELRKYGDKIMGFMRCVGDEDSDAVAIRAAATAVNESTRVPRPRRSDYIRCSLTLDSLNQMLLDSVAGEEVSHREVSYEVGSDDSYPLLDEDETR